MRIAETLANGYSSDRTPQELSNEYQHGRVQNVFKDLSLLVPLMKVASAVKGLRVNGVLLDNSIRLLYCFLHNEWY